MNQPTKPSNESTKLDPVFVHSRRESVVLLVGFAVFFIWSVGVSYLLGYGATDVGAGGGEVVRMVLGMPHWVFWGVAAPWMGANVFTFWFCLCYMADDPLGEALDEQQAVAGDEIDVESGKDSR